METSIYRLRSADVLLLCVLSLLALGVVMVQSAAVNVAASTDGWGWSLSSAGSKQLIFAVFSFLAFLAVGACHYNFWCRPAARWWKNPILWILVITVICNVVVLIPHVGKSINGARRWLPLGPLQFEPSELAKWAVVLFVAYCLNRKPLDWDKFFTGYLPMLVPVAVLCVLVVIQDFGTATLIALCALAMLLAARVRWRHLLVTVPPIMAGGLWLLMHTAYRWRRVTAFIDPYAAPQKEGYHMIQSLLSFATGGFTGRGLGNGIQKLGYLPEDTTDFLFSVICEELGFFGALLTVFLYVGIIYVTWQALRQKKDDFGRMLAFGIGGMVSLQALINIAVATVSVPTKGLSLPLVSAGGSGLVITGAALGLLLSVCRHETEVSSGEIKQPAELIPSNSLQRPSVA
ncbi:MAG TPA: putative peptidoglycan glycosyltransferase FtsW [Tepidisphaeraceae bacterium]|nr:putative peptidoglycan glycosyltransferase FtsW [Tepidisphaeraceae bacterium]